MHRHYCYIIKAGPFCKIGYTSDIKARIVSLQTGCPFEMELLVMFPYHFEEQAREMEKHLHGYFARYRVRYEWYKVKGVLQELRKQGKLTEQDHDQTKPIPFEPEIMNHMREISSCKS